MNDKTFFLNPNAKILTQAQEELPAALAKCRLLAIVAHPDDVELLAMPAIMANLNLPESSFACCVLSDGASSPRGGPYSDLSQDELVQMRLREQAQAAGLGHYRACISLQYSSADVRASRPELLEDMHHLLEACPAEVIYTHNLADRHATHCATALRVIAALRKLPSAKRPKRLIGGEVWRSLDWLPKENKLRFDLSAGEELQRDLLDLYHSQIEGGKAYRLAAEGRQRANACFDDPYHTDAATLLAYGMDMSAFLQEDAPSPEAFLEGLLSGFTGEILGRVRELTVIEDA